VAALFQAISELAVKSYCEKLAREPEELQPVQKLQKKPSSSIFLLGWTADHLF